MFVKFTEEELKDIRQYWYSKYCQEVCVPEKKVFLNLYEAYDNLLKFPTLVTSNINNDDD